MAMRPLAARQEPSLFARALGLALSPVVYGVAISTSVLAWGYRKAAAGMQLPIRITVAVLELADAIICDVLALLSKQPGLKAQVEACEHTISALQLTKQAQERQILLLQQELDHLKLERSKAHRKTLDLNQQLQRLQQRLSFQSTKPAPSSVYDSPTASSLAAAASGQDNMDTQQQPETAAAAPDRDYPAVAEAAAAADLHHYQSGYQSVTKAGTAPEAEYGGVPARGWYLHACVVVAALGVRWWLTHQTDPLQRKVMLVIIWPAVWVYGGLLFKCFPNSYTLRATLACTCWALLGYVANEMVAASVRGRQQASLSAV